MLSYIKREACAIEKKMRENKRAKKALVFSKKRGRV
jgi:hypothetical protein